MQEIYDKLFKILDANKDSVIFDVDDLHRQANNHLFALKLKHKYGFNINTNQGINSNWDKLIENVYIGFYDGKIGIISWEDNGNQPKNEILLSIQFPTGPYIFGEDYPEKLFNDFFTELKSYNPKYIDSNNSVLYFTLENGAKVFNNYKLILQKYFNKYKEESKQRKIEKLKSELEKLQK